MNFAPVWPGAPAEDFMHFEFRRVALALAAVCAAAGAFAQSPPLPGGVPQEERPAPAADERLSADVFYRVLLGEVALQRGEPHVAARAYLEAARESRQPRLARRAAEIALMTRQRGMAEQAANLWLELEPAAERPRQILAALTAGTAGRAFEDGADSELRGRLERLLADAAVSGGGVGEAFLQLNRVFGQQSDKLAVYRLIAELAAPYPATPEAHFAIALAAYNTGLADPEIAKAALAAAERALALRPDWERGALLKAEILHKRSVADATAWLETFLRTAAPESKPVRGALAQYYVEQKRFADARALYRKLHAADPSQRELQFGSAVLSVQMKDWDAAEAELAELKRAGFGDAGQVEFYLAQVSEERGRHEEAIARYRDVPDGDRGWLAQLRIGILLGKLGRRDAALAHLRGLPAVTQEQKVQVRQAEAQLHRDANDNVAALEVLDRALAEHPDASDLLYDRAMVAEKAGRIDEAERGLRRLVELKPEDAQALNALGYTLVDRTDRIDEGFALIQKAHKLAPADPFILDSMGWALFRLGRLNEAEDYLQRAFAERPDPEIAAHLGEVLWAKGQRERARDVWQSQLKLAPDHPLLLETVRRFQP
jgi:tetratricopeptide (TPR) repeat protein